MCVCFRLWVVRARPCQRQRIIKSHFSARAPRRRGHIALHECDANAYNGYPERISCAALPEPPGAQRLHVTNRMGVGWQIALLLRPSNSCIHICARSAVGIFGRTKYYCWQILNFRALCELAFKIYCASIKVCVCVCVGALCLIAIFSERNYTSAPAHATFPSTAVYCLAIVVGLAIPVWLLLVSPDK